MGFSIEWLLEFIDAFIDGDALPRKEPEEYDCAETTWGVFKAYAFFFWLSAWAPMSFIYKLLHCMYGKLQTRTGHGIGADLPINQGTKIQRYSDMTFVVIGK